MAQIDEIRKDREATLEKVRALGWDPYISKFDKKQTIAAALQMEGQEVQTAGRVVSSRTHGNIMFMDLRDPSGKIQLFFQKDMLGADSYKNLRHIDIGDHIGVSGKVMKTTAGEISIQPTSYTLLTKAMMPLPTELKDVETRYRKRYLDLLVNEEVRDAIAIRSKVISFFRQFMQDNGFMEVETPVLQPLYGGTTAKPFKTHHNALDAEFYLRIAPELYLKRLLVGGFERVFEIGKVFRNEGFSRSHNPEFTMFEFYWAYADYNDLMDFTEKMLSTVVREVKGSYKLMFEGQEYDFSPGWERKTFRDLFIEHLDIDLDIHNTEEKLAAIVKERNLLDEKVPGFAMLMDEVYKKHIRPNLKGPMFVIDHPVELMILAKRHAADPSKASSFQLLVNGAEFLTSYNELNDSQDQKQRWLDDMKEGEHGAEEFQILDEDYVEALSYGMPPTAGWGLGVDRFVAFLADQHAIKDVIMFPTMKPDGEKVPNLQVQIASFQGDSKYLNLAPEVKDTFQNVTVGYALVEGISVDKTHEELERLKAETTETYKNYTQEDIDDIPAIQSYRKVYEQTGVDLNSRKPSPEALLKRISEGKDLYTINTCVDAMNVVVLTHHISLGVFDADTMKLPAHLAFAKGGETVELIGGEVKTVRQGELCYFDGNGVYNLDLNYRDSDRTKVTEKTKNLFINIEGVHDISKKEVQEALNEAIELIQRFCGGTVKETGIVPGPIASSVSPKAQLTITRDQARELMESHIENKNLQNHCKAVAATMRTLATKLGGDEDLWEMAGLLHDADWEETQSDPSRHTAKTIEWLKEAGENHEDLHNTILTHNHHHNGYRMPESLMEWALYTCDELTGFIVAVALTRDDKKLASVEVKSVLKKFPQVAFAKPVDREQIKLCEEKLGIPLEEFVQITLQAMQSISDDLGL